MGYFVKKCEPREADVALETKAYKEWKDSGRATRETCPLDVKAYEQVRMIEKSAYLEVCNIAVLDNQSARELRDWAIGASMYAGPIKKLCEQILEREK